MDCTKRRIRRTVASDLPEDSMVEILARVPVSSLCRSKCVAKAWRDVIQDPFHRRRLPQTLQGFFAMERVVCRMNIGYARLLARSAPLHMDPSISFLTKLPGFELLSFSNSCNGLLVFEHIEESLGYVVCNPITEQWVAVPPPSSSSSSMRTGPMYLVFDPAVSCHFHLVQFVWGWPEKFEEEGFVVDDDDYNGGEEGNHDYQGRRHQQHDNDDDDSDGYDDGDDDYDSNDYDDDDDNDDSNDEEEELLSTSVNVYSSESGQWVRIGSGWGKYNIQEWRHLTSRCAVLNGMLDFIISNKDRIAVVDVQGVTRKMVPTPIRTGAKRWPQPGFVAQSQGCLHYINKAADDQLSIWVLEDYDTQNWVSKHSVSLEPFGRMTRRQRRGGHKKDYSVVAIHPDANVVYIFQNWNRSLKSYDFDHKLVSVIRTLDNDTSTMDLVPYVPCFLESPALTNRH